jgi:hypothetical protein
MLSNILAGAPPGPRRQAEGAPPRPFRAWVLVLLLATAPAAGLLQPAAGRAAEGASPSEGGAGAAPAHPSQPAAANPDQEFSDTPPPPPDLVVLARRSGLRGRWRLGVFGRQPDPGQPLVWRIRLWEQTEDRVFTATDVLNCSPAQPMRITGGTGAAGPGNGLISLRDLNPGGPITPANRLDHQIWWAACVPEQAGKDPATLGAEARRLGFSGTLVERERVVPGPRRP